MYTYIIYISFLSLYVDRFNLLSLLSLHVIFIMLTESAELRSFILSFEPGSYFQITEPARKNQISEPACHFLDFQITEPTVHITFEHQENKKVNDKYMLHSPRYV